MTPVTPGRAGKLVLEPLEQCERPLRRVAVQSGAMPKVTTLSTFRPRSTRLTLNRLLVKSPAATSSTIDRPICAVARAVRKPRCRAPAGRLTGLALQRRHQVRPRAVKRREQSEEKPGADVSEAAKSEHAARRAANGTIAAASGGQQRTRSDAASTAPQRRPGAPPTTREQAGFGRAAVERAASAPAPIDSAPPSRRCAPHARPAAGWRCSRRQSAARGP